MKTKIINKTDLGTGSWSAEYHTRTRETKPYVLANKNLTPINSKGSIPYKGVVWLTDDEYTKLNDITQQIKQLEDVFTDTITNTKDKQTLKENILKHLRGLH